RRGHRQRRGGRAQVVDLLAAGRARRKVGLELRALVGRHGAEHVRAGAVGPAIVVDRHMATWPAPSCARIFCRPSRMRPLMVPTGVSSMSAISVSATPPKYASSITWH